MSKVTILMPVHGDAPFLAEALRSIDNQTFKDFETLIILDRANEETTRRIEKWAPTNKCSIRYSDGPGIVAALNTGLALINSEYVARFDSDDIMFPERLEKQVEFLDKHPEILAVGSQIMLIDEAGREMHIHSNPTSESEMVQVIGRRTPLAHPSVMFRRKEVVQVGNYREFYKYAEDYDLWMRLFEVGKITNLEECLLWYRIHNSQVSRMRSHEQNLASQAVLVSHRMRKKGLNDLSVDFKSPLEWYESIPSGLFYYRSKDNYPKLKEIFDLGYQESKNLRDRKRIFIYTMIQFALRPIFVLKIAIRKLFYIFTVSFAFFSLLENIKKIKQTRNYPKYVAAILLIFLIHPKKAAIRMYESIKIRIVKK